MLLDMDNGTLTFKIDGKHVATITNSIFTMGTFFAYIDVEEASQRFEIIHPDELYVKEQEPFHRILSSLMPDSNDEYLFRVISQLLGRKWEAPEDALKKKLLLLALEGKECVDDLD